MGILVPLFGIGAGIVAIISGAYIKSKQIGLEKLKLERQLTAENLEAEVKKLSAENEVLQDRISNLETIVVSKEWESLVSDPNNKLDKPGKVKALAEKI